MLSADEFQKIVAEIEKRQQMPAWKRGVSWALDHAFWSAMERVFLFLAAYVLGVVSSHPLLTYDIAAHWLKQHLP
jgi:hypothetical protein